MDQGQHSSAWAFTTPQNTIGTCKSSSNNNTKRTKKPLPASKVLRYMKYGQALAETDDWRSKMADRIQDGLPAEVQDMLFGFLAVAVLPGAMYFDNARGVEHHSREFTISARIRGDSTLEAAVYLVLAGLSNMAVIKSSSHNLRSSLLGKRTTVADTTQLFTIFSSQIEEAIMKNITVLHSSTFATKKKPTALPYPSRLLPHKMHLSHLCIIIKLGDEHDGRELYPTPLYNAQDGIPKILTNLSNLKILSLHLVEHRSTDARSVGPRYVARLGRGGAYHTTLKDDFEKVVSAMRELKGLKQRVLRYSVHSETQRGYAASKGAKRDAMGKKVDEVVEEIVKGRMIEFLV